MKISGYLLVGRQTQLQGPHPPAADGQAGAAGNGRDRERRHIAETRPSKRQDTWGETVSYVRDIYRCGWVGQADR